MKSFVSLLFPTSALAGSVLWNGVFNSSDSVADLDDCTRDLFINNENILTVQGPGPTKLEPINGTSTATARPPNT